MRVLLDTNVLLMGACERHSIAASLDRLREIVSFVAPATVYNECRDIVNRNRRAATDAEAIMGMIQRFAHQLGLVWVDEARVEPPSGSHRTSEDEKIIATALALKCEVICTYNLRDFSQPGLAAHTPLTLLRTQLPDPGIKTFVQNPVLGHEGTILIVGTFVHPSAIGDIARFNDDSVLRINEAGEVQADGTVIRRLRNHHPIPSNQQIAFAVRYRSGGNLEMMSWAGIDRFMAWAVPEAPPKALLATATIGDVHQARVLLCFRPDHNFFGAVMGISAIPRFVPDRKLRHALRGGSLEALVGSSNLAILQLLEFDRLPDGTPIPRLRIPNFDS